MLTDAASYMKKSYLHLKSRFTKLVHVFCKAHLFHNCAMKIKAHFKDVNFLISSVKSITVKNKNNSQLFDCIGKIPDVIITRWGSWLKAAIFYSNNLIKVRNIVEIIEDTGVLISKAKSAVKSTNLKSDLTYIYENYANFIDLIEKIEKSNPNMVEMHKMISSLKFENDILGLESYINRRIDEDDFIGIIENSFDFLEPAEIACIKKCPATTITIERAFSMIGSILDNNRHFADQNIENYVICYFNCK